MKRYLYQKDYHTPPWAMEYEVESAIENRTMVYVTMFSEELDNVRNSVTFTVSSKTPFGLTMKIRDHCIDRGITFTEYDFNQVEWEMSRYF